MKKMALAMTAGVIIFILSSCGQKKDLDENQTYVMNSSADKVQEIQNDDIVNEAHTDLSEEPEEERQSITDEVKTDLYEGEYCDYEVNEPSLEIQKNEDGTYQIQINIFRMWYFHDGVGRMTEDGLEFTATGPWEEEVNGIVKLEEDAATVTILGQAWLDFLVLTNINFIKHQIFQIYLI